MNPYASHIPTLQEIFAVRTIKTVLEFGPGDHSTPFFVSEGCKVTCVEMQNFDWGKKINDRHYPDVKVYPATEFADMWGVLHYAKHYDLVMVDGHYDNRPEVANWAKDRTGIIVIHDTEDPGYGWERLQMEDWHRYDSLQTPRTTVFSKNPLTWK